MKMLEYGFHKNFLIYFLASNVLGVLLVYSPDTKQGLTGCHEKSTNLHTLALHGARFAGGQTAYPHGCQPEKSPEGLWHRLLGVKYGAGSGVAIKL